MPAARATSRTVRPACCLARVSSRPKSCWVAIWSGSAAGPGDAAAACSPVPPASAAGPGCSPASAGAPGSSPAPRAPARGSPWSTATLSPLCLAPHPECPDGGPAPAPSAPCWDRPLAHQTGPPGSPPGRPRPPVARWPVVCMTPRQRGQFTASAELIPARNPWMVPSDFVRAFPMASPAPGAAGRVRPGPAPVRAGLPQVRGGMEGPCAWRGRRDGRQGPVRSGEGGGRTGPRPGVLTRPGHPGEMATSGGPGCGGNLLAGPGPKTGPKSR